ncbi:hypothetical protein B0H10DRAFT_1955675 [Mycena sp. CBHHK59/15]|nr:hypothetical protein B0H10DRAFT_1955675 [Mycena sp. CBHHK59/15]
MSSEALRILSDRPLEESGLCRPAIRALVNSNNPPIDSEVAVIHEMISSAENELRILKSLLLPLRQLPSEILAEIFMFCLSFSDELDTRTAPWVLGQICARWRAVALSTPRLWQEIHVHLDIDKFNRQRPSNMIYLLDLLLRRSGSRPLTVRASCERPMQSHQALDMLMRESHRWADVDLYIAIPLLMSLAPIKGRLQVLHTLNVFPAIDVDDDEPPVLDAFQIAPMLRRYTMHHTDYITVLVPSEQLEDYSANYGDLRPLLDSLRSMENLVHCDLDRKDFHSSVASGQVHLPHLRDLSITEDNQPDGNCGDLLDRLVLPKLESFTVDCSDDTVLPHLTSLITRSSCSLKTFSINIGRELFGLRLLQFLKQTPTLARVTVEGTAIANTVLSWMTCTQATPFPLPNLRDLHAHVDIMTPRIVTMVRSRLSAHGTPQGIACLQWLGIKKSAYWAMSSSTREDLVRLTVQGLHLTVK